MNTPKKLIDWVPYKNINYKKVNELLQKSVETGRFSNNGPNVQLLEKIIREKLQIEDSKAVIVVTNGSVALHSLSSSIQYYHKEKINWATQSFTFPPSAQGTLSNAKIYDINKFGKENIIIFHYCGNNGEQIVYKHFKEHLNF